MMIFYGASSNLPISPLHDDVRDHDDDAKLASQNASPKKKKTHDHPHDSLKVSKYS